MKTPIFTLGLALSAMLAMSGCGGDTTNGTGATNTGNNEIYIGFSPTVGEQAKETLYKTDGTVSGTTQFSGGIVASDPSRYKSELVDAIEEDGNYLFVTDNKVRNFGCSLLLGCGVTQFLYLVDKNSGAVEPTFYTAGVSQAFPIPAGPIYHYASSSQPKHYIFSNNNTDDVPDDYKIYAVDTQTGAHTQISLNGSDKGYMGITGKTIDDDGNKVYFVTVDSLNNPTAYNIYSLNTDDGTITDYPALSGINTINLYASGGKLYMFTSSGSIKAATMPNPTTTETLPGGFGVIHDFSVEIDGKIYFAADDTAGGGRKLFVIDPTQPTSNAVSALEDIGTTDEVSAIFKYNAEIYYVQGGKLYKTDNNPATTQNALVSNIANAQKGDNKIFQANGKLYFRGIDASTGSELWSYDSAVAQLQVDINPGTGNSQVKNIIALDANTIIFQATADGSTNHLYKWTGGVLTPLN